MIHTIMVLLTIKESGDPGGHDGNKGHNSPFFNGAWSVYPYFQSRNIIISDINLGLFIVRKSTIDIVNFPHKNINFLKKNINCFF